MALRITFRLLLSLLLACCPCVGRGQSPLQSIDIAGQKLELWSVETTDSILADNSAEAYPGMQLMLEDLQELKDKGALADEILKQMGMQYGRWESTERRGRKTYAVLGMLLRDQSGKISSDNLSFSVATRAVDSQGNTAARWPEVGRKPIDCLLSERVSYVWNENRLVPLPVSVPEAATELSTIDAFAIITPVARHRFVFDISELKTKARKSDDVITIVPMEFKSGAGTEVAFEIFRPLPEIGRPVPRGAKSKASPVEQVIESNIAARRSGEGISLSVKGKTATGEMVAPNGSTSLSASRQYNAEASVKAELKMRTKDSRTPTAVASDRKKIVANLRVDLAGYRFKDPNLQQVVVEFLIPADLESVEKFQLQNVALQSANQRAGLQTYLSSLEYAEAAQREKPATTSRTWKDPTGKFAIEAELVLFDGQKVVLKKSDGKTVEVPISKLSDADRKFLDDL